MESGMEAKKRGPVKEKHGRDMFLQTEGIPEDGVC
jgi:hypothetical protein